MRAWWIMLLALAGLARRPLRVALTVLGVTIAAGALFSMVGFALGVQRQAEAPFEKLDLLKNIEIWPRRAGAEEADPDDPDDGGMAAERDGEEITQATAGEQAREDAVEREPVVIDDALLAEIQELPGVALAYPEFRMGDVEIRFRESRQRCTAVGTPRELGLLGAGGELIVAGSFFSLASRPEVMITEKLVEALGLGSPRDAIGKTLTLRASGLARRDDATFEYRTEELEVTLVGVYTPPQPAGAFLGRSILLPVDVMKDVPGVAVSPRHHGSGAAAVARGYARAIVRVERPTDLVKVEKRLKEMGLGARTSIERLEEMRKFFVFLDVLLAAVGTVALVVAALGIINTLLMAVLERYQEIGTYKAIGAADGDIVVLFLTEAILLGLAGGLGGLALGSGVSWALEVAVNIYARGQGVEEAISMFSFPGWLSATTVGFTTAVAAVAGAYPALRAARIDPIRALRGE